jgi:hypothetical protein
MTALSALRMPWYVDTECALARVATIIDCPVARFDEIGSRMTTFRSSLSVAVGSDFRAKPSNLQHRLPSRIYSFDDRN